VSEDKNNTICSVAAYNTNASPKVEG